MDSVKPAHWSYMSSSNTSSSSLIGAGKGRPTGGEEGGGYEREADETNAKGEIKGKEKKRSGKKAKPLVWSFLPAASET
jgi:hypothetical protein